MRNIKNKIVKKLTGKRDGYAWFAGVYFVFFALLIVIAVLDYYMIGLTKDKVEDALTSSSLGSLIYDKEEYALSKSYILLNTDTNYQTLKKLVGDNLGLTNQNGNEFSGKNSYITADTTHCKLVTAIFYNKYSNGVIKSYKYDGNSPKQTFIDYMDDTYTPLGDKVVETSVFVIFEYPTNFFWKEVKVRAASYVALTDGY